jgi:glycosyltransferase involved in cell wall biosynthesis
MRDSRFKYKYKNNSGVIDTRNLGISISTGKYILPLDGDDIIEEHYLESAVDILNNDSSIKIVYCKAKKFGAVNEYWSLPVFSYETMLYRNCIFNSAFFRREDFDRVGGYRCNMYMGFEDWDLWLAILTVGGKVHCIDKVMFYYRIQHISRNANIDTEKRKRLMYLLWCNNRGYYAQYYPNPINSMEYHILLDENKGIRSDYENIRNSFKYRLGSFLLSPIICLRNIILKWKK